MPKSKLDYALFRVALRRWIAAHNESYDIDYKAAYESFVKRSYDMSWLEPYISEVLNEHQSGVNLPSCGVGASCG